MPSISRTHGGPCQRVGAVVKGANAQVKAECLFVSWKVTGGVLSCNSLMELQEVSDSDNFVFLAETCDLYGIGDYEVQEVKLYDGWNYIGGWKDRLPFRDFLAQGHQTRSTRMCWKTTHLFCTFQLFVFMHICVNAYKEMAAPLVGWCSTCVFALAKN